MAYKYHYGSNGSDYFNGTDADQDIMYGGGGIDQLKGAGGNDSLYGEGGDDHLYGDAGDDTLSGGDGNDYLNGGTGADYMSGGAGNDLYSVDNAGDKVVEAAVWSGQPGGIDEVHTSLGSYSLPDQVENLTYSGSQYFTGFGNALDNTIKSGSANDVLKGGGGNDTLDGGAGGDEMYGDVGNDVYIVDNYSDKVNELVNEGTDEVRTSMTAYGLGQNVENLTYTGTEKFEGGGNELNNVIKGGANDDKISGRVGNDWIEGGDGNDQLDIRFFGMFQEMPNAQGADTLVGGKGHDSYGVDNVNDVVVEYADEGIDDVTTTLSQYTLGANVENLSGYGDGDRHFIGNALDNKLYTAQGNDRIDAGDGNDYLYAGGGDDVLTGGAGDDIMQGASGADTFAFYDQLGNDTIVDFKSAQGDRLDMRSVSGVTGLDDLAIANNAQGNAVITYGDGMSVTLKGVDAASVDASYFHFKEQGGNQGIAAPAQATELPPAQEADVIPAPTPEQAPQDFIPEMAGMFEMDRGLDVVQYASVEPLELYAAPEIDFGSMLSVSSLSAYHLV